MFFSVCLFIEKSFACLLCLWVVGFLVVGVRLALVILQNCLFPLLREREAGRELNSCKSPSVLITMGRVSFLQLPATLGGRKCHIPVRDLRAGSTHSQDRRIRDPHHGHFIFQNCPYTCCLQLHVVLLSCRNTGMSANGKLHGMLLQKYSWTILGRYSEFKGESALLMQ